MSTNLRKPDFLDDSCAEALRGQQLQDLVSQTVADYRGAISLLAWDAKNSRWCIWFDRRPTNPPLPSQLDNPPFPDPLKQAGIAILP